MWGRSATCGRLAIGLFVQPRVSFRPGRHRSKSVDEFEGQLFDYVITVCNNAKESCPVFFGAAKRPHHNFDDPAALNGSEEERLALFRRVRDELRSYLAEFARKESSRVD
jgi:protein-tyrosine-phosphatase